MTLQTAIADYLSSLAAEGRSPRTVDAYRRDLDRLVAFLGADVDVAKVTPQRLLAFASSAAMAGADGEARHPTSNNRTRSAVRGLFGYLTTAWVLERDPAKALRVRAVDPPRPRVLAEPEEVKLRAAVTEDSSSLGERDRLMVDVLLATGIRVSSLVALNVDDVDLDAERLWIRAKGGRRMSVALPRALGERLVAGAAEGPLFRSRGRGSGRGWGRARCSCGSRTGSPRRGSARGCRRTRCATRAPRGCTGRPRSCGACRSRSGIGAW